MAVKVSEVPGLSVASPELVPSSPLCEDCEFFRFDYDVDSCCSGASVVSSPVFVLAVILKFVLTSCGKESLLNKVLVLRFAIGVRLVFLFSFCDR